MDYRFSVVMAVYNTERYLREAVESLIAQDIGFDRIQLILVDDGSRDQSGSICDEYAARYPDNVLVLHQKNAGVSAARNAGLAHAQGRYVNFMDSDDRMSPKTFSLVWDFFEANREQADLVSVPIVFFDGHTGPHLLNSKFSNGSRVIDLRQEWRTAQLHIAASFIRRECLPQLRFRPELKISEDAELVQRILLQKQTLGVVAEGEYQYRYRSDGQLSAIQSCQSNPAWYWPRLQYWLEGTVDYCLAELGAVPRFIQYTLMYDLRPYFKARSIPAGVLTAEEEAAFLDRLYRLLSYLDDEAILAQMEFDLPLKLFVLTKKHGRAPELELTQDGVHVLRGGERLETLALPALTIIFIRLEQDVCEIDAAFPILPGLDCRAFAELDGVRIPITQAVSDRVFRVFGEAAFSWLDFRAVISLSTVQKPGMLRLGIETQGRSLYPACKFEKFAPISRMNRNKYYFSAGRCIRFRAGAFLITSAGPGTRLHRELLYLAELFFGKRRNRKAGLIRLLYWLVKPFKRRPLWVISDRRLSADDNGEAFFRFLRAEHREINAVFVLRKAAKSYPELSALGRVIENDTLSEKLLILLSDYVISSQSDIHYYNPFSGVRDVFRDLMADRRFVFLQHGIIKDDLSDLLYQRGCNFFGFVTAAYREYRSILDGAYGYTERELWLTGLPRFDLLEGAEDPRQITVMPTWRTYLCGQADLHTMTWKLPPDFHESEYCRFYEQLLSNERLLRTAESCGYTLAFLPHPTYQPYPDAFRFPPCVRVLGFETPYRKVYKDSALIVTDYSSAVFDFAYMKKPVIYAQFDREVFVSRHGYRKGYFDYERDGFGEVEYDLDATVDRMIEYMQNACVMKPDYAQRVDRFFAFRDRNNCQRLYERMLEP